MSSVTHTMGNRRNHGASLRRDRHLSRLEPAKPNPYTLADKTPPKKKTTSTVDDD